jgi:prophage tail gpP-like protein
MKGASLDTFSSNKHRANMEGIETRTKTVYRVGRKTFLTLWGACLHKAKQDMKRKYFPHDHMTDEAAELFIIPGGGYYEPTMDWTKWSEMKRQLAREYIQEFRAANKTIKQA